MSLTNNVLIFLGFRYQQILQYHLCQKDYQNVITCCRRFGNQDSSLWIQALWAGARNPNVPPYLLNEILGVIGTIINCY